MMMSFSCSFAMEMSNFTELKVLGSRPSPGPITKEWSLGNQVVIEEHTSDSGSFVDLQCCGTLFPQEGHLRVTISCILWDLRKG